MTQVPVAGSTGSSSGRGDIAAEADQTRAAWPNEFERLVEAYNNRQTLTAGEAATARKEIKAQARRRESPPVIKRETVHFEPSSIKGLEIAYIVAPHLGAEVTNVTLEVDRLPPGAHTEARREYEAVCHVLNGTGYSIIRGRRCDWQEHDSFHIPTGAWYQHFNSRDDAPAHLLVGRAAPIIERIMPHALTSAGDDFTDSPDDYRPEHPFTGRRVTVDFVGAEKWMSHVQDAARERKRAREKEQEEARLLLRAEETVIERSQHRGDWKVGLVDRHLGFANRLLSMYVHQMPPGAHTETHKHGEAIVYVLSGRGHSIVEGDRYEWRAGDCIFVKPGQWHQHFNDDPDRVSQHVAVYIQPIREQATEGAEQVEVALEPDYDPRSSYGAASGEWWQ